MKKVLCLLAVLVISVSMIYAQSKVTKESVPGISNMARLETTVACAGSITPASVAEIKKMGFKAVINLREASEPGADIEAEAAAAKAAGVKFAHIPFNSRTPDPAVVDRFLKVIAEAGSEPAFIHCAGGNRAAAMWFIKRAVIDKWEIDRAMAEATDLGFTSQPLKTFAIDYIQKNKK